jgi:hypothetical protein
MRLPPRPLAPLLKTGEECTSNDISIYDWQEKYFDNKLIFQQRIGLRENWTKTKWNEACHRQTKPV